LKTHVAILITAQVFFLQLLPVASQVQPVEVKHSQEKTIINGRMFFIHTVQKGQTLFSISKAYEITQEDLLRENPGLEITGLKEGQAIRIPEPRLRQAAVYPENKEDFYEHIVKRGQTVYSLARKYHVTEELIYHYNPWARNGIKADQTVWIPRKSELYNIQEVGNEESAFFYYTVKQKDTLYTISRLYGTTVADIIDNNPDLRWGLKTGQVLKIPKSKPVEAVQSVPADSATIMIKPCQFAEENVTYDVALMLPFFAKYNMEEATLPIDSLAEEGTYVPLHRQKGLRGRNFAEFYEGFLLAVDSLKKTGLSVNLHVYDTERDSLEVKKVVRELSILQPDLIIGPVYSEDVSITSRLASYLDINLVSPLSTRPSLIEHNPRLFQVIPSRQAENEELMKYIIPDSKGRLILIRGDDTLTMKNSWSFKKYLLEHLPGDSSGNPLQFYDYKLNDSLITHLGQILSKEEENILIIFSENEPDVSRLISGLYMISALHPMKIFGMSSWQTWKTIDLNYLHNLQLYLITPFYADFTNNQVRNFLHRCRNVYGYEPYEISPIGYNYCMLGYDIGFYFLSALKQYGKDFQHCLDQLNVDLLLSDYRYVRDGEGGYMNTKYSLIQYTNDFTVIKVSDDGQGTSDSSE
jgi:LysM repeat protein/ABC-type branched-subunit amino acid transport system substrate-binding protein